MFPNGAVGERERGRGKEREREREREREKESNGELCDAVCKRHVISFIHLNMLQPSEKTYRHVEQAT